MSVVVNRDWRDIVESCVLENWREALAALVTYAKAEEFTALCDLLGQRLEQEGDEHCSNAMVCYICAGNVEKFVSCWCVHVANSDYFLLSHSDSTYFFATEDVDSIQYLKSSLWAVTGLHSGNLSYRWLHNLTKPSSLSFD